MYVKLILDNFFESHLVTINGVEGVFIPAKMNFTHMKGNDGRVHANAYISIYPATGKKRYDYCARVIPPRKDKDDFLLTPSGIPLGSVVGYGYERKSKESDSSSMDNGFNAIVENK